MIYTITLNPAVDKTLSIPDFASGKVNRVTGSRTDPGGKGINVSKTVKALGGQSVAMGIVGGEAGKFILGSLDKLGIEHDFVETIRETRTNIKITDPATGNTTDINEPGHVEAQDADNVLSKLERRLKPGDIAVIAGKIDVEAVDIVKWIRRVNDLGARAFLDTEGKALLLGAKAGPYLIKPNEREFSELTGEACDDTDTLVKAVRAYRNASGIRIIALSLGERGAIIAGEGECLIVKPLSVPVVSTVGAGDSMMAGLSYALNVGKSLSESARLAAACATAAVGCPGTQSPTLEAVKALQSRIEIRCI